MTDDGGRYITRPVKAGPRDEGGVTDVTVVDENGPTPRTCKK